MGVGILLVVSRVVCCLWLTDWYGDWLGFLFFWWLDDWLFRTGLTFREALLRDTNLSRITVYPDRSTGKFPPFRRLV
jgi:hypothetical protein